MRSSRTAYREKRIDLITGMINTLAKMLILYKRDLELIKLPQLKKLSEEVSKLKTPDK